jgi:Raf kinase inhibitor-like YbhB/YbcL family protein
MIRRRNFLQQTVEFVGLTGFFLIACSSGDRTTLKQELEKTMRLESTAFAADGLIPAKYTCDGANVSPPLQWRVPPTGTQSLVVIVDDPDAPLKTFVHWVLYDLPAEVQELPESIPPQATLAKGGTHGKNDFGQLGYGGPCPPRGTHRYFFKVYALDRELGLAAGATKAQIEAAMNGHILAAGELIGRYARQH